MKLHTKSALEGILRPTAEKDDAKHEAKCEVPMTIARTDLIEPNEVSEDPFKRSHRRCTRQLIKEPDKRHSVGTLGQDMTCF